MRAARNTPGNGRPRLPNPVTWRRQLGMLKSRLHGHPNRLNHAAPPEFSRRPYNNLVLQIILAEPDGDFLVTTNQITGDIIRQLGLDSATRGAIVFKMHRVDYYATATSGSSDRPACKLIVSSLIPTLGDPVTAGNAEVTYGVLYRGADQGNLSECAKVSYTWPLHMQDIPLSLGSNFGVFEATANVPFSELRIHLSWSTIDVASPVP